MRSIGADSKGLAPFFMSLIEHTCCFTRHRIIANEKKKAIFNKTREIVISLIEKGVRFFGVGGAIGYDTISAYIIMSLKKTIYLRR